MNILQEFNKKHDDIKQKLMSIELPDGSGTGISEGVGFALGITGQTVRNHLRGIYKDGYLAEAIYKEFKRLKIAK